MNRSPRKYTTAELEALPTGTILSEDTRDGSGLLECVIWVKDTTSTVKLLSHGAFDYDNPTDNMPIKLFATDEPSNEGLKVSSLRVVGFDQYSQKHVYGQGKMRIYFNRNLNLSPGKLAAQAVHAALQAMGVHHGLPVVVLQASPSKIQEMRTHIYDAGHTEVEPNTLTTGTEWPMDSHER